MERQGDGEDGEDGGDGEDGETERAGDGEDNQISEIVPAMGWIFNEKGEVTLTAYKTTDTDIQRSDGGMSTSCSATEKQ